MTKCVSKKIEIDMENLIVRVERGVTLGELEEYVGSGGLMFAPYTPDKKDLKIEEMYTWQISSLTGQKYGLPKFHVMGMEVVLADGKVLKTGGKTVKNVTGYDLTRFFLSSRESLGKLAAFTLKLLPLEETRGFYLLNISGPEKLQMLLNEMNHNRILPAVSCFWDISRVQPVEVLFGFAGIKEKVEQDLKKLTEIVQEIEVDIFSLEGSNLEETWQMISRLRKNCSWHDCFKISPDKLGQLLADLYGLDGVSPGLWGNPLQGSISVMLPEKEAGEKLYQIMAHTVKELGGDTNWYYDRRYNMENPVLRQIADRLKNAFEGSENADEHR